MRQQYHLHRILLALIAVTLAGLAWNQFGMRSVLTIDGTSGYPVTTVDDRRETTGKSVATLIRQGEKLILECEVNKGYEWPYCEMHIELQRPPAGLDFRSYDRVRLWIAYQGPEKQQPVRFFVRNFNPAYSSVGNDVSLKAQELSFDPRSSKRPIEAALSKLTVSSWWTNERNIAIEHAGIELDNISTIQVVTGGVIGPGLHRITVDRIEFEGKVISSATFRLLVLGLWLLGIFVHVVLHAIKTGRELKATSQGYASLKRINDALQVQSSSLAELARHDPLTGLLNRNGLSHELVLLAKHQGDQLFPLSLVFLDIDHFKNINDQHGHAVGDDVIRGVSNLVRDHIQRRDVFARWGGEEFLLLFPGTQPGEAALVCERLRQIIVTHAWPAGMVVTCSFGVAQWHFGEDLGRAIERADKAMYRAKREGRNRVELEGLVRRPRDIATEEEPTRRS
jgi:diguanylate cyclase (GGDEF)-like protein